MLLFVVSCLEVPGLLSSFFLCLVHVCEEGVGEGLVVFPLAHKGEVKRIRKRLIGLVLVAWECAPRAMHVHKQS